ncbi:MAG TPA: AMP-binding protein [Flavobacterium sp.]|nr:AMP-binding protein [Flavobacterium sp.]
MISYKNVHNHFRINGQYFTKNDMLRLGSEFIKDGNHFERAFGLFVLDWFDKSDKIKLSTSGTTGEPKEIQVRKQAMVASALATGDFFGLQPKDKALCCLPIDFIAGKMMIVRAFILGLDMSFVAPTAYPLENIRTEYDFCAMTPMQVENSLEQLQYVKKLIIGGAKLPATLEEKLKKQAIQAYETYASTETLTHIAARKVGEENFKLLPNIAIAVDDRGCLVIDAPRISADKIVTNDLVDIQSETEFNWVGRVDNVVNSGGIKLFPEKIESHLNGKIPHRYFVGGVADTLLGEKLVLLIEAAKYELPSDIFEGVDNYEKPKNIIFVAQFAETENGKIRRREILDSLIS